MPIFRDRVTQFGEADNPETAALFRRAYKSHYDENNLSAPSNQFVSYCKPLASLDVGSISWELLRARTVETSNFVFGYVLFKQMLIEGADFGCTPAEIEQISLTLSEIGDKPHPKQIAGMFGVKDVSRISIIKRNAAGKECVVLGDAVPYRWFGESCNIETSRILCAAFDMLAPGGCLDDQTSATGGFLQFAERVAEKGPEEISWDDLRHTDQHRWAMAVLRLLKDEGYCPFGIRKSDLERATAFIAQRSEKGSFKRCEAFFAQANLEQTAFFKYRCSNGLYEDFIATDCSNDFLLDVCEVFLSDLSSRPNWFSARVMENFESSLGEHAKAIKCLTDFSGETFWTQINWVKEQEWEKSSLRNNALKTVINFYRTLVNKNHDLEFFGDCLNMSTALLNSNSLVNHILEGACITTYITNGDVPPDNLHYVFLLKGFNTLSTRKKADDFIPVDLSVLQCPEYRQELLRRFLSNPAPSVVTDIGQISLMARGLQILYNLKSSAGYPNPGLFNFTDQDAVLLRQALWKPDLKLSTNNNRIGAVKRFLQWEEKNNENARFGKMFFDYLSQYEEPSRTTGEAVPEADLVALNEVIVQRAANSHLGKMCQVIFHLLLQTEFRVSQICSLEIDSIRPAFKPNMFVLHSYSKTSRGMKDTSVITDRSRQLLQDAIEASEELRERCSETALRGHIFLYEGKRGAVRQIDAQCFRGFLRSCCKEAGFEKEYSAGDLRDTHMSRAFEYVLRTGRSDLDMRMLSKHKRFDTTSNHYIEMQLNEMLEASYGIIIGDRDVIDPSGNIAESIPVEMQDDSHTVENGCGCCSATHCIGDALPCLACKHFKTTIAHAPYFERQIAECDKMMDSAKTPHDKDDIQTIKLMYVLYLKEIYMRMEGEQDA